MAVSEDAKLIAAAILVSKSWRVGEGLSPEYVISQVAPLIKALETVVKK